MESSPRPVVLCLGPLAQCEALAAALLALTNAVSATTSAAEDAAVPPLSAHAATNVDLAGCPGAFREFTWRLDTKYYAVNLRLWVLGPAMAERCGCGGGGGGGGGDDDGWTAAKAALGPVAAQIEGAILAFDPAGERRHLAVSPWVDVLEGLGGVGDDSGVGGGGGSLDLGLQLLVAVAGVSTHAYDRVELIDWGLDRAFEFVDVEGCTLAGPGSYAALVRGAAEREKEGAARCVEAAEATAWSAMERKQPAASVYQAHEEQRTHGAQERDEALPDPPPAPLSLPPTKVDGSGETPGAAQGATQGATQGTTHGATLVAAQPLAPQSFSAGDYVVVAGLVGAAHHNGRLGRVLRFDRPSGRFAVRLLAPPTAGEVATPGTAAPGTASSGAATAPAAPVLAVKGANLRAAGAHDLAAAAAAEAEADAAARSSLLTDESADAFEAVWTGGGNGNGGGSCGGGSGGQGGQGELGGFEELMDEVRRTRDGAKSLSDTERRAAAASTAMKLLAQLGDDSDDSGGSEEGSCN